MKQTVLQIRVGLMTPDQIHFGQATFAAGIRALAERLE